MIIAIQVDRLETLNPNTDTTLFIASELCKFGYRVFFYTPDRLYILDGSVYADGRFAEVYYSNFTSMFNVIGNEEAICLTSVSAVLVRQNPPFNMNYITSLYILDMLPKNILVLNKPSGLRECSEKIMPLNYPSLIPPTIVISSYSNKVLEFLSTHRMVILKPLYWFGGKHMELLDVGDEVSAINSIAKAIEEHGHILLQKFFSEISDGDKRIFLMDGKPVAALKRVPKKGEFLANLASGGTAAKTEITDREREICSYIGPYLKKRGIFLAGVDVIKGHLIEVNVTSPTGFVAIDKLYGINLAARFVEYIDRQLNKTVKEIDLSCLLE